MAVQTQTTAEFSKSLGRLYALYTGGFLAFVVMLFMFARQQDKIDREFGVAEEDD